MRARIDALLLVFFVSGFGGLIYESVWSHYARIFLGHAAYAQTLVLVVFIGGLAAGAAICARFAQRLRNPLRIYAMVEGAIGLMAIAFHPVFTRAVDWSLASLLPAACQPESPFCPAQWIVSALLLAPQSILLGATFPLMSSAVLRLRGEYPGHDIASLYFVNSFGAALGVLGSAFVLIPAVGLPGTLATAGALNIALAAVAAFLSRTPPSPLAVEALPVEASRDGGDEPRLIRLLLATAFLTGLSSFVYEIAWIRMLSLVLGASTHAFELMLASFILGLALGGLWVRQRVDALEDSVKFLARVQLAMGVAAAGTLVFYIASFDLMAWLLSALSRSDAGFFIFNAAATAIALLVMLPATFCAGMTLPLITYRLLRSRQGERALGTVYAVNTLGSIAGVVLAVHLLLALAGVRGALLVGAALDVGLGVLLLLRAVPEAAKREALRRAIPASVAVLLVVAIFFPVDPRLSSSGVFRTGAARVASSVNIPYHRDGKTATISILEQDRVVSVRTNGKPDASLSLDASAPPSGDEYTMTLLALLPLGHRPDAKTAAVIGFGSGMSTAMLLGSPTLERVDSVEIEPAMVEAAAHFRPVVSPAFDDPRSRIVLDDAKSYFARGRAKYDIVVSEPSNPWVSGVASLFTEEFYVRISGYMNDGAVLSQWLHTYEMDSATLASIFAAVAKTFPQFVVYTSIDSDIVLVARKGGAPGSFDPKVLKHPALQPMLAKLKLTDPDAVLRRQVASSAMLLPLFARYGVAANSDYFPVVEHRASKTRFTQARVPELVDLGGTFLPMREMLDGAPPPSPRRPDTAPNTVIEAATREAWALRDALAGTTPREAVTPKELAARTLLAWADQCPADLPMERALPAFLTVAESTIPFLDAPTSAAMFKRLADSRCGRAASGRDASWLALFEAVARRDAPAMATRAEAILATDASRGPASEYALFAAVSARLCLGDRPEARALLEATRHNWVRIGYRVTELRLLDSLSLAKELPARCAPAATASPAARRSP